MLALQCRPTTAQTRGAQSVRHLSERQAQALAVHIPLPPGAEVPLAAQTFQPPFTDPPAGDELPRNAPGDATLVSVSAQGRVGTLV